MARRKRAVKRKTSRRRRVSGIGSGVISQVAGIAAGAVGASFLTNMALKNQSNMIKGAAAIAVGMFLPKFVKGSFGAAAASGAMAAGALGLVKEFAPTMISGNLPMLGYAENQGYINDAVAGIDDQPEFSGLQAVAGLYSEQ
jgi:hypothetical protein